MVSACASLGFAVFAPDLGLLAVSWLFAFPVGLA